MGRAGASADTWHVDRLPLGYSALAGAPNGGTARAAAIGRALGDLYMSMRLPTIVVRPTGQLVAANPAALATYGYSIEELTAMRVHDLIADARDVDGDLVQALHGAPVVKRRHRKRDGTLISVQPSPFTATVLGETVIISVLEDVTPLDTAEAQARAALDEATSLRTRSKAMYTELLAAERLATMGRLVAGVAHEVNNPAALVTVNLGVLRDRVERGCAPKVEDTLAMIDESLEAMTRIRDIVRDLKGFTRERPPETIDLSLLAAGAVRMTKHQTRGNVQVEERFDGSVLARARGSRVSQVLTNLLLNATQATLEGPDAKVVVRTFHDRGFACIEVSDSGPGVPAHLVERIFEPFFTTREEAGGTGLGLWVSRGIVEEEGGTLQLCSRVGGAVFRVSLPGVEGTSRL